MNAPRRPHAFPYALLLLALVLAACGDPANAPPAPSNVAARAHPGFNRVTWEHGGAGVEGFAVYRAEGETAAGDYAELARVGAGARSFDDRAVVAGGTYRYAVAALGGGRASARAPAGGVVVALAPPGFSAALEPDALAVLQGGGADFELVVAPERGFAGKLALELAGEIAGLSLAPSTVELAGEGERRFGLTLTAAGDAAPGGRELELRVSGGGASASLALAVAVAAPNRPPPSAHAQALETDEDVPLSITLTGSHPDGDELAYSITAHPENGALSGEAPHLTYAPDPDWHGEDSFEFEVRDGHGGSGTAAVTVTVRPVYDEPVIEAFAADRGAVKFGEPVTFAWSVRHVDGTPLACRLETGAAVHELGDCAGAGSRFHLYPNVNGAFEAQLVVDDGTTELRSGELAVAVTRRVTPLAGDSDFSTGIREDGTVVVWGGGNAQLRNVPADLAGVVAVATRWNHILALDTDGTVTFWGYGNGDRGTLDYLPPLVGMAAAQHHALGVTADGRVVAWGAGTGSGELDVPADLGFVIAVAAGPRFSLALRADGTVVGWGQDNWGQATPPAGLTNVTGVAAGALFSAALQEDGAVVAWGAPDGRIGVPAGLEGVTAIAAGDFHGLALRKDGTVVGWGSASYDDGQFSVPASVEGVAFIVGARAHSLALTADGKVVGWGDDEYGQAGPPVTDDTFMLP